MLYLKSSPVGVDIPINLFQKWIYQKLLVLWKLQDDNSYESYGRCYCNKVDGGFIPEVYDSSLNLYKEVFFDETNNKVLSFFHELDSVDAKSGSTTSKVSLIFYMNISKLVTIDRADEEIKTQLIQLFHSGEYGFQSDFTIDKRVKNVFKEFDGLTGKEAEVFKDLHPFYCIRFNFNVLYDIFDTK